MEIKKVHISMPTKQLGSLFLLPLMIFGGGEIEKLGNEGCSLAAFFFSLEQGGGLIVTLLDRGAGST
jgi:hypothetical protein